jgi:hypothetical protein
MKKNTGILRSGVSLAALLSVVLPMGAAQAQETFTVNGPTTETNGAPPLGPPVIVDGDDTLIVTDTGSIAVVGDGVDGVDASGSGNSIINRRFISTDGLNANGISVLGGNNTVSVTGNGQIETAGTDSHGIALTGNGNSALYDGLFISTSGDGALGIQGSTGAGIVIETRSTNGAEITTQGNGAHGIGIRFNSDNATVLNGANIFTTGTDAHGIFVSDDSEGAVITNTGNITTEIGGGASGIRTEGANTIISNSGSITTSEAQSHGIYIFRAPGSQANNSGFISVSGDGSNGMYSFESDNIVLLNSGEILVTDLARTGMETLDGTINNVMINSGLIRGEQVAGEAILVDSSDTRVLNSGEIRTDPGITGINVGGGAVVTDVFVRNTGRIFSGIGAGDTAFGSGATTTNTHLRLDPGSIIVGEINFTGALNATLDVGLPNAAFTLTGLPDTILSDGRPQLVDGTTLYVFDPAHFAAMDQAAFSTLDQIGFALDQRLTGDWPEGRSLWATGNILSGGDTDAVSGMLGTTFALSADRHLGGFVGTQTLGYETAFSSSRIDSAVTFGGLTWGGRTGSVVFDTALSFGTIANDSTRRVANNTVLTGIEDATASPDSRFFGLSATIGTETRFGDRPVRPSLRLRYGWQRTDAFAETGSQADMIVGARVSQRVDLRARVDTDLAPVDTGLGPMAIGVYGGLDLGYTLADDVMATVAGLPVNFGTDPSGFDARGFVGAQATIATRNGASLSLSGEIGTGGDAGSDITMGLLYRLRF